MKIILSMLLIAVGCSSQQKKIEEVHPDLVAVSDIHSAKDSNIRGMIKIEELKNEIKVTTDLKGLRPNSKLGFHIHENGICEGPDYKSAGDHLNPMKHRHGRPEAIERHLGDMGNLVTNASGESRQVILLPKSGKEDVKEILGKAVLIHAGTDDLNTQPSGNSGDRIACGLIKPI